MINWLRYLKVLIFYFWNDKCLVYGSNISNFVYVLELTSINFYSLSHADSMLGGKTLGSIKVGDPNSNLPVQERKPNER